MEFERSTYIKIINSAVSTVLFLVLAIISLVIFFLTEKHNTKNIAKETFVAISDTKTKQVSDWYLGEVKDVRLISTNQFLVDLLLSFDSKSENYHNLVIFLNQIKTEHIYADVIILTVEGEYIASTNAGNAFDDPQEIEYLSEARKTSDVFVSDIYRSIINNDQYIDFISDIKNNENQEIACLVLRVNPVPFLKEILVSWPLQHKTAETFLVCKSAEGKLLKYINSTKIPDCWVPFDTSSFNQKKVNSLNSGFVENGFSDGKQVFSYINIIPKTPWGLIVEVDKNEIFESLNSRIDGSIFFVVIICLVFFVLTYFFINIKQGKIIRKNIYSDSSHPMIRERFSLIMDMLTEGVIVSDDKGLIQYMNLKAETILGWELSKIKGKNIDDYFRLRFEDTGFNAFSFKSWQNEESGLTSLSKVMLIEKDDRIIPVSCSITPIKSNNLTKRGLIVIVANQTEKRYQENLINKSEMRFRNFFQDAPDATIIVDNEGIIRQANMQALLLFGYSMHELTGIKVERLIPQQFFNHAKTREDYFEYPKKMSTGTRTEIKAVKKNGLQFSVLVSLNPIVDDDEHMAIAVIRDITILKEYESDLVAAKEKAEESEQLKTAFLANISHEIRTPLNGIIGFSSILREKGLTNEEVMQYSELIGHSGEKLLELLNNLIDLSKLDSGGEKINSNTFIVSELIKNIYNQFIPFSLNKDIDYKLSIPKDSNGLKLTTDNVKLGQILTNFLSNAFKFTIKGSIELGYKLDNDDILFYVKDAGPAIQEDHNEKIFERFFQANVSISSGVDGSGLGLAICKGYANLLGGKIWFENEPDIGKTFFFKLIRTKN